MSAPSIEERRKVAIRLRGLANVALRGGDDPVEFIELLDMELFDYGPNPMSDFALRLADLIDPAPWERTVEDSHRLLDRCRELEIENSRLKARLAKEEIRWEA